MFLPKVKSAKSDKTNSQTMATPNTSAAATTPALNPPATPTSSRHETPRVAPQRIDVSDEPFSVNTLAKIVPVFDGSREGLTHFIENASMALSMASERQQLLLLPLVICKIQGRARNTIKHRTILSWPDLKQFLLDTYSDKRAAVSYQIQLATCRQESSEPVVQFGRRVENILGDLLLTLPENTEEEQDVLIRYTRQQALDAFINGLQPRIGIILKANKPASLEEAVSQAVAEEKLWEQRQGIQPRGSQQQPKAAPRSKCFKCNKIGHMASECRSSTTAVLRPITTNSPTAKSQNTQIFCRYCKKPNHTIQECRKRERRNKEHPPIRCNFCKNVGHQEANCRKKQNQPQHQPSSTGHLNWS